MTYIRKILKEENVKKIINVIFFLITIAGIGVSIYMNYVDRSIWGDEASLADSFTNRNLITLCLSELENLQTAPVVWLYFEKILTLIFGNSTIVIRWGSTLFFAGAVLLMYLIGRNVFKSQYPFAYSAFVANIPYLLKYSNEFKPYIAEAFFVLLAFYLFYLYKEDKIKLPVLCISWSFLIWCGNPCCFVEGGLILSEIIYSFFEKDYKKIRNIIIAGISIVASFIVYYFFWLKATATSFGMQYYWENSSFPLIPTSLSDLLTIKNLVHLVFRQFKNIELSVLVLTFLSFVYFIWKKNRLIIGLYLGFAVALFASYINMFPVTARLWCFFYPLVALIILYFIESFISGIDYSYRHIVLVFCMAYLICSMNGIVTYSNKDNVYRADEEIKFEIDYLKENIKEDEKIYLYNTSVGVWEYINGYGNTSFGGYDDNVVFGTVYFNNDYDALARKYNYQEELKDMLEYEKMYIVIVHYYDNRIQYLIPALYESGYVSLVSYEYETPLLYYCKNIEDTKTDYSLEIIDQYTDCALTYTTIRISNTGGSYINNRFENIYLKDEENGLTFVLDKVLAPGEYTDVTVSYSSDIKPVFNLYNSYKAIGNSYLEIR
ncbi:MAG: glycosyltransferase family 39 protein [Erysipelotrichaceae bacterium]|nr:glycosyltransferase family 39 protein [Erysipelotrichaceae bacterium]